MTSYTVSAAGIVTAWLEAPLSRISKTVSVEPRVSIDTTQVVKVKLLIGTYMSDVAKAIAPGKSKTNTSCPTAMAAP